MKAEFIIDDAVIDVVRFEDVFQTSRSLLRVLFNVVDFDGWDLDGWCAREGGEELRELEASQGREHGRAFTRSR